MVTQTFFIFTPNLGEMIQFDEHIFQMGWFNHQLEKMTSRDGIWAGQGCATYPSYGTSATWLHEEILGVQVGWIVKPEKFNDDRPSTPKKYLWGDF